MRVDAARALDVQYKARQIIERINAYFGYRAVADLRIVQTPIAKAAPAPREVIAPRGKGPIAGADMSQITDERLKAALERLARNVGG